MKDIGIQTGLRLAQIRVRSNADHLYLVERLEVLSNLLRVSYLESHAVDLYLARKRSEHVLKHEGLMSGCALERLWESRRMGYAREASQGLRVSLLRQELGNPSLREFSCRVSVSEPLSHFCGLLEGLEVRGSSKSRLSRLCRLFGEEELRELHGTLVTMCGNEDLSVELGLAAPLDFGVSLVDGTCLEAHIAHPTDWRLLGDVGRTLLKGIVWIRSHGLLNRMTVSPQQLQRSFNKLGMEMTQMRRRKDGERLRKDVLRRMKRLLNQIGDHAVRHLHLLELHWQSRGLPRGRSLRLICRMQEMLKQLPKVIHQAHERIIGGRLVANADKILSVYDPDVQVIIRGKASGEIEYGNQLLICESPSGFITDWQLYRNTPPPEALQSRQSVLRQLDLILDNSVHTLVTDRGFNSKAHSRFLHKMGIDDATCPRDPHILQQKIQDPAFAKLQKRRASTEARIAIVKNSRLRGKLRDKGFDNKQQSLATAILAHNLWILSAIIIKQRVHDKIPIAS